VLENEYDLVGSMEGKREIVEVSKRYYVDSVEFVVMVA